MLSMLVLFVELVWDWVILYVEVSIEVIFNSYVSIYVEVDDELKDGWIVGYIDGTAVDIFMPVASAFYL